MALTAVRPLEYLILMKPVRILTLFMLFAFGVSSTAAVDRSAERSAIVEEGLRAVSLSARNTLAEIEKLENVTTIGRTSYFAVSMGKILTVDIHAMTKYFYETPVMEIDGLVATRDYSLGRILADSSPREREKYVQRIANEIGDLNEVNEKIATAQFEYLKSQVDVEIAQQLRVTQLGPEDPRAIDYAKETFLRFVNGVHKTHIVGDENTLMFLVELLIMNPLRQEPRASDIAVSLIEKFGQDPRMLRSGVLAAIVDELSRAPGRLGEDPRLGELVEVADDMLIKMQQPLWQVACEGLLAPPHLN